MPYKVDKIETEEIQATVDLDLQKSGGDLNVGNGKFRVREIDVNFWDAVNDIELRTGAIKRFSIDSSNGLTKIHFGILNQRKTLTISAGQITLTSSFQSIETQAAAATDNLDTINGGVDGMILYLEAANSARTVVVRDQSVSGGNIDTQSSNPFSLTHRLDKICLIYRGNWQEYSRSNNA